MPKVTLISHSPHPQETVAAAAKLCYSDKSASNLLDGLDKVKTEEFVRMLMGLGHESPVEHVSFTFAIEGVSRAFLAQITRHRMASYSVQSQRYVKLSPFEYVLPSEIAQEPRALAAFDRAMENAKESYKEISEILLDKHKKDFLAQGLSEKQAHSKAEKLAIEDARFVLPNACETKMVMTMNARSLYNFFHKRCCSRAQWEIREVADEMLRLVKEVAPILFESSGPPCVSGACPEGKMTCGQAVAMRNKYRGIVD